MAHIYIFTTNHHKKSSFDTSLAKGIITAQEMRREVVLLDPVPPTSPDQRRIPDVGVQSCHNRKCHETVTNL